MDKVWRRRTQRAEFLADEHAFAKQILDFYIRVADFQRELYRRFEQASGKKNAAAFVGPPELAELVESFPAFLAMVSKQAPPPLAEVAHSLAQSQSAWTELLNQAWQSVDPSASGRQPNPADFLALAFLQPYAEFVRSRVPLQLEGYTHALCPFCSRKPGMGVLRQMGDGARRNLLCGFCLCEWEFRRIVCPGCDEKDHAKLPVYTAEEFPYIRVECCDTCRTYLKSIDLSKNGRAEPIIDELASIPLDLWAQQRGYAKLHLNLLGL